MAKMTRAALACALLLFVVGVAGCGGDESGDRDAAAGEHGGQDAGLHSDTSVWISAYGAAAGYYLAWAVEQTSDYGYVLAGWTETPGFGTFGLWVMKLDELGVVEWQKAYGDDTGSDKAYAVAQTMDGGYIVAGETTPASGGATAWVLRLDSAGAVEWQKAYGDTDVGGAFFSIEQTADGGYVAGGSVTGEVTDPKDAWVMKLDAAGAVEWQKAYGDTGGDGVGSVKQTADGGYVALGTTSAVGGPDPGNLWLLKLDSSGGVRWQKSYGGDEADTGAAIRQTSDGGYIVTGSSSSFGVSPGSHAWVLKLDQGGVVEWSNSYGSTDFESAEDIQETADGGYIVAAETSSAGVQGHSDAWLLKLTASGAIDWHRRYGGQYNDTVFAVRHTADNAYVVAGYIDSLVAGSRRAWLLKVDGNGEAGSDCGLLAESLEAAATAAVVTVTETIATAQDTTGQAAATTAGVRETEAVLTQICHGVR